MLPEAGLGRQSNQKLSGEYLMKVTANKLLFNAEEASIAAELQQ
jgi:hypothetical protein